MQMPPTSPDTALESPALTAERVTPPAGRAVALRWRQWLGLGIVLLGMVAAAAQAWQWIASQPTVEAAWWGGLVAALATALGTLPVLLSQRLSERAQDTLFGFGAGATVGGAILLGALVLLWMERLLPHEHFIKGVEGAPASRTLQRTWLFVFAIALHNLPEGLAIGVAHEGGDPLRANALATGIAIQDVPEGLVVAMALLAAGYRRALAVGLGMASGLVEPLGAVLGAAVVSASASLLPWGLGFAAGAMLFVISHEIIPESHRKGHEAWATGGLMVGFVVMMLLDTALG